MEHLDYLKLSLLFLTAAVTFVPLFKKLGLGSILGYLAAGSVMGPFGFNLVHNTENLVHLSEFGVVMLLFLIGLELKPIRLWQMRKSLFGLGAAQVFGTALVLAVILIFCKFSLTVSVVIGISLSLSSTAFAIQAMTEKNQLNTQYGRHAFSILLFQDLIAIPLIAFLPVITSDEKAFSLDSLLGILRVAGIIVAMVAGGRYLIRPILRLIANSRTKEIFTAMTLLIVLGVAALMQEIGLSMALGAFLAGVLLSDSEYRHQVETDLEPFKGLLLGLFFIMVGISVNYGLFLTNPGILIGGLILLVVVKYIIVYGLGKYLKLADHSAQNMAVVLSQGGEFAFVVFATALAQTLIDQQSYNILIVIVTFSMIASAVLAIVQERLQNYIRTKRNITPEFDTIPDNHSQVIIAGFGRVGQIPGRLLRVLGHEFTALELDPEQVEVIRRFGNPIYYGDAARLDLLQAAGAAHAKYFVLAIDDVDTSMEVAEMVREHFPHLRIFARARNRAHVFKLRDLGITDIWRETFSSSLKMSESLLKAMGYQEEKLKSIIETFCKKDSEMLESQYKVHHDEESFIATSKQANQQLTELLSNERANGNQEQR